MFAAIEPDEFLAGLLGGRQFCRSLQFRRHPKFFAQLARRRRVVLLARSDVARCAGIPKLGMPIFPARTFLQKQLAGAVEKKDVHGAMPQVIPMHFAARRGPDDAIVFIDDGKLFGEVGACMIGAERTGRRSFLMEIDPPYCDVIVDRFQRFTGRPGVLERTGESSIPMGAREEQMR